MRIDKYLWCVRKYKTRSIATEAVRKERIEINGEVVKASRELKVGDEIGLKREGVTYLYKVLDFPKSRVGAKLVEDYVQDVTPKSEMEKVEFVQMMKSLSRKKGTGRPTKKDRRDLDDLFG